MLEPEGVDSGDGKKPDGIIVFPFSKGILCTHVTCPNTYANTSIYNVVITVGHAARETEQRIRRKYGVRGACFRFEPVVVETTGVN